MDQPGLDLSVVEIDEGDSTLEHLGDDAWSSFTCVLGAVLASLV